MNSVQFKEVSSYLSERIIIQSPGQSCKMEFSKGQLLVLITNQGMSYGPGTLVGHFSTLVIRVLFLLLNG